MTTPNARAARATDVFTMSLATTLVAPMSLELPRIVGALARHQQPQQPQQRAPLDIVSLDLQDANQWSACIL